jgi:hypothetical protein
MEDSTSETFQFQNRRDDEKYVRDHILNNYSLILDKNSMDWIMKQSIAFSVRVEVTKASMKRCYINDDEVWYKVGQAIGNLQALKRIIIHNNLFLLDQYYNDVLDWEILARILSQVRQKIEIDASKIRAWDAEESRSFARAIHGHPTITSFDNSGNFPHESLGALYSALATLPALGSLKLCDRRRQARPEEESATAHYESLTELLRMPSLRSVCFDFFSFTPALCQLIATATMEGTAVTSLEFQRCSFSAVQCAVIMANGLVRNTSVSYMTVESPKDGALYGALAAALPSNSTLRNLYCVGRIIDDDPDSFWR